MVPVYSARKEFNIHSLHDLTSALLQTLSVSDLQQYTCRYTGVKSLAIYHQYPTPLPLSLESTMKKNWIGHVVRDDILLKIVLTGIMEV